MVFLSILVFFTDQRKSALGGDEEEKFKLFFDHNQLIGRNAENYEEMLTLPMNKNKNMIYQGMNANHKNWI